MVRQKAINGAYDLRPGAAVWHLIDAIEENKAGTTLEVVVYCLSNDDAPRSSSRASN